MKHKGNYAAADAGFTALVNLKSRLKKWLAFDKQLFIKCLSGILVLSHIISNELFICVITVC